MRKRTAPAVQTAPVTGVGRHGASLRAFTSSPGREVQPEGRLCLFSALACLMSVTRPLGQEGFRRDAWCPERATATGAPVPPSARTDATPGIEHSSSYSGCSSRVSRRPLMASSRTSSRTEPAAPSTTRTEERPPSRAHRAMSAWSALSLREIRKAA